MICLSHGNIPWRLGSTDLGEHIAVPVILGFLMEEGENIGSETSRLLDRSTYISYV